MKATSPFFARIARDVLGIMSAVPPRRLVTFAEVGAHLDVMPRHVAYTLAMLDGPERDAVPWQRGVSANGRVDKPEQRAALEAEGVGFDPDGRVAGFLAHVTPVVSLPHRVAVQKRPADAPVTRARCKRT